MQRVQPVPPVGHATHASPARGRAQPPPPPCVLCVALGRGCKAFTDDAPKQGKCKVTGRCVLITALASDSAFQSLCSYYMIRFFKLSHFFVCLSFSNTHCYLQCLSSPWQLEEKARLEAEARAREHLHLREEQRRREGEQQQLKEELQRLQELQKLRAVKKKKKERPSKDCPKLDMLSGNFQEAAESVPDSGNIHNGSLEQTAEPETSSHSPSRHADHTEPRPGPGADGDAADPGDTRDVSGKPQEPLSFLLDIMHQHKEGPGRQKLKQAAKSSSEPGRKPAEPPRASEGQPRPRPQTEAKAKLLELPSLAEQKREERKASSNNSSRKLNHVKEDKWPPGPMEPASPSDLTPGTKLLLADSPQPRGKSKKNKKKKGDRVNSSIGKCGAGVGWGSVWPLPVRLCVHVERGESQADVPSGCPSCRSNLSPLAALGPFPNKEGQ